MKKLVIIPAFNESGSILRAVQDIKEHAPGCQDRIVAKAADLLC